MTRFLPSLLVAAVLAGPVVLSEPAWATPNCRAGAACPGDGLDPTRQPTRPPRIVRPIRRPLVEGARALEPLSSVPVPSRYVSLMILGVGY